MGNIYVPDKLEKQVKEKAEDEDKYPYQVVEGAISESGEGLSPQQRSEARDIAEETVEEYASHH